MRIYKSFFLKKLSSAGKISLGTIISQLISFITLPIFTRLYGPTIIGNWTLINSISIIIISVSDLGLTNAIIMKNSEDSAGKLYRIVSTISFFVSSLIGIGLYLYNLLTNNLYKETITFIIILVLFTFISQQTLICYTWLNRRKQYDILMRNPLVNNIAITIFGLSFAFSGFKENGYFYSMILGQLFSLLHMKKYLPKGFFCFDYNEYKQTFKENRQYIIFQMPSTLLLQFKSHLPTFLIKRFFGSEMLGYYSVAIRVLNMPITFLANSLGKVFFQNAAEIKREKGDVGLFTLNYLKKAMRISFLPIILMLSVGDIGIRFLFGNEFSVSANILRIMSLYAFFLFLSMSVNGIAIVIDKQKYLLYSGISQLLGIFSGVTIGSIFFNNIYISLLLLSITFIAIQIFYFCYVFRVTQVKIGDYLIPLIKEVLLIIIIYLICRVIILFMGLVSTI